MRTPLKILIALTIALSLVAAFIPQVLVWLALTRDVYLWKLVTYALIEPGPVTLGFTLQLGFNMYVLWMFGSMVLERAGVSLFFLLYFGAALAGGLAAFPLPHLFFAGTSGPVYAILIAWAVLNPRSDLLLFFALPFKAHWLIGGLIGVTLFLDLSAGAWAPAVSIAASVLYAYLFSFFAWRFQWKKKEFYHHSKIFDIKSGAPVLDDNQFMDAMLDQISRLGEGSLTAAEKKRMKEISEKKK